MRDIKEILEGVDSNKVQGFRFNKFFKKYFSVFSVLLLLSLISLFVFRVYKNKPYFVTSVMSNEIRNIVNSLNKIDKDCNILSIENERNFVDFLNVEKFSGSEVGCLNLAYPEYWKGPYLKENPTYHGKLYELIKTKEGVFVVPGNGVKLPNGLVIGKDFEIQGISSIKDMIKSGGPLNHKGQPLAAKLEFKIGDWGREDLRKKKIENLNKDLREFNEAIPFSLNESTNHNC